MAPIQMGLPLAYSPIRGAYPVLPSALGSSPTPEPAVTPSLGVSRQGYYQHVHRSERGMGPRERSDQELIQRIRYHHEQSRGTYGAPRIQADLSELDGLRAGRNRINRLMRHEGLVGVHRRTGRKSLTVQDRMATTPPVRARDRDEGVLRRSALALAATDEREHERAAAPVLPEGH